MSDEAPANELRLRFYSEGDWWICSLLLPTDNIDSIELGRVRCDVVDLEANHKAFIKMMRSYLSDFISNTSNKP